MRNTMIKTLRENISHSQQNMLLNIKEGVHSRIIVLPVGSKVMKHTLLLLQLDIFHPLASEKVPAWQQPSPQESPYSILQNNGCG